MTFGQFLPRCSEHARQLQTDSNGQLHRMSSVWYSKCLAFGHQAGREEPVARSDYSKGNQKSGL